MGDTANFGIERGPIPTTDVRLGLWARIATAFVLLLLIVIATILRVDRMNVSFQGDEILTMNGALLRFSEVVFYRPYPLYYILAHFSLLFGETEVFLRLPSVIAGVLSVPASYFLAKEVGGRRAGVLAALLSAISTYNIHFSVMARFYALVMLAEILLVYFLYKSIVYGGWKNWTAFVVTALWGMISQLTVAPFYGTMVFGAACWVLLTGTIPGARKKFGRFAVLCACAMLGMSTLAITVGATGFPGMLALEDADRAEGSEALDNEVDPKGYTYDFVLTPSLYWEFLVSYMPEVPALVQCVLAVLMLAGILVLCRRAPAMAWIVSSQFLLVPLPFFFTKASHWYNDKYFCSLVPLYILLAAVGCSFLAETAARRFTNRRGNDAAREISNIAHARHDWISNAIVVFIVLAYSPFAASDISNEIKRFETVDWKEIARYLAARVEPGDVIAFSREARARTRQNPPEERVYFRSHPSFQYYFELYVGKRESNGEHGMLESVRRVSAGTPEVLEEVLHRYRKNRVWSVVTRGNHIDGGVDEKLKTLRAAEKVAFNGGKVRLFLPR